MRVSCGHRADDLSASPDSARIGDLGFPADAAGDSHGSCSPGSAHAPDPPAPASRAVSAKDRENSLVSDSFVRPAFTIEQVRTFLTVASREHITQAARALGLSQPAVTQQVQLLERTLGVQLLERLGRGVRLTDAGEQVAGACLLIMRSLENLERTVHAIRGLEGGSLTLGATQVCGSYYLSPALTAFSAAHPSVTVDITTAPCLDICDRVCAGILECALVDGPLPRMKLDCARVASDEMILVVHPAHRLARASRIFPDDLAGTSLLTWEYGGASETVPARLLGPAHQILPRVYMASIEAVRRAVMAEPRLIATLPRIAIAENLGNGTLVWAARRTMTRSIWAIRRQASPLGPAAAGFWDDLLAMAPPLLALTADVGDLPRLEDNLAGA